MRALSKEALSQTGLSLRRRQRRRGGEGASEVWAVAGYLMQAAVGAAQVWCL